ncbi:uncharacterized protein LOC116767100 isoform X2 [Danaus plexippus]|uniref:uncharacterized protein LOC116767100 isoform X2 n=1 Tax=Danaus plexippus TaxID=13037 RepID=UPI002AB22083|nr:uncharacterized protein LOC116767100 isoform X2 [Danaus plexippus]
MVLLIQPFFIYIFILLLYHFNYGESKNYCNSDFCIDSKEPILCNLHNNGPSKDCSHYEKLLKTEKDKQDILNKINQRRNKVASGDIRSLPPAANMLKMEWNEQLEISAQRWADQCFNSSVIERRDVCTNLVNETVGQNVATIYGEAPGLTISSLVDIWYMELLNMNSSLVSRYRPSSLTRLSEYDNFTQLVWAETNRVGCAAVKFKEMERNETVYRLVCNFAPSGNRFGDSVYNEGQSCSRCPSNLSCDSQFRNLCCIIKNNTSEQVIYDDPTSSIFRDLFRTENKIYYESSTETINAFKSTSTPDNITEEDAQFDFLSDLFEITKAQLLTERTTLRCKDYLAVDDFIELLKSKLTNDQILKNLLATSAQTNSPESTITDRTMAAMINQIYSTKTTATTTKTTVNDYINSTLLVDLVEAVIFRHSNRFSTIDDVKSFTQYEPDISVVKVQAQTGEVKSNKEFTGHFFFPEEEESVETNTEDENTESYYDSDKLAVSDISMEIEDLKRDRITKDFIEEILDSELATELIVKDASLPDINTESSQKLLLNNNTENEESEVFKNTDKSRKSKRDINFMKINGDWVKMTKDCTLVRYKDLLRNLANDLRKLKLQNRFSCAHSSVQLLSHGPITIASVVCFNICSGWT